MKKNLWRGALLLVLIWALAGGALRWVESVRPTPEKLATYLAENSVGTASPAQREDIIARTASQLNYLTFEQRQELRESGSVRSFFEQLTAQERAQFLDLTLPEGFRQLMNALNKMGEPQRKKIVDRVLNNLQTESPELAERIGAPEAQKIISQGLSSFYEEADASVKLDFAPVIEQLQRATQSMR